MTSLVDLIEIMKSYNIDSTLPLDIIRVNVMARLPRSEDRKLFNRLAGSCNSRIELMELSIQTLQAFEKRKTPLLPPPLESKNSLKSPYIIK